MTLFSFSCDFTFYFKAYFMDLCDIWDIGSVCDVTTYIITNVGHLDLYFMVQWFCLISWMLFDVWTSFGVMSQYAPTVDLQM